MVRHHSWNAGSQPVSRNHYLTKSLVVRRGLLMVFVAWCCLNAGCTQSGTSRRSLTLTPLNKIWLIARSYEVDSAPNRITEPPIEKTSTDETSQIRMASGQDAVQDSPDAIAEVSAVDESASSAPIPTEGTSVAAPSQGLTLDQLELLAVQNNPTLSQAQSAISAEQGIYRQAGLYPNPQVGYLNGAATRSGVKQSNGMFFSQEIVTAHKLDLAQQAAAVEIQRYQWDYESQRMRIVNDLRMRYYELLGAQEALAVAERLVKIAEKGLTMAEKRMEGIHGTKTDLLQARVQLETVRLTRDEAEHRYAAAWARLTTMVGLPQLEPVHVLGDLTNSLPQLDQDTCLQTLLSSSPQIRSTECDLGHAWATYREARADAIPNVTIQTVGEYDRVTQATTVSTLVALPLPITNRNQGNIDKSSADIVAAQSEICRVQLVLREQLADSFQRYKTSLRQAERFQKVILPSVEENLKLTEQIFESGDIALKQVLEAQETYFKSQIAYVEALTELNKVVTEIQGLQLTGGLNPAAIGSAIQNQPGGGAQRQRALLNEVQDRAARQLLPAAQIGR